MRTSDFDPVAIEVFHRQLKLVTLLVVVVFGVLVLRLGFLQIAGGMAYRAQSENNRIRLQDIPAVRGLIYDAHGDLLVSNRPAYDLYAIPEDMGDQRELLEGLERLIGLQPETVEERLKGSARRFPFRPVRLVKDMSREELAVIETHRFNLPGIMINVRPQRYYHFGPLGFHVLGYLGEISESQLQSGRHAASKSGDWIGQSGVERRWESALGGERGGEQLEMDAVGRRIRVMSRKAPVSGANVFLTLDRGLQALAEKALAGQRGTIVAVDPRDGALLALASSPALDPNTFVWGLEKEVWEGILHSGEHPLQNRASTGQYPPGSIFKVVMALAGLEEGVADPADEVFCPGSYQLGTYEFRCWKKGGHGKVNLRRALVESCDVYFYRLAEKLGVDTIARYAKRFGFGRPTGLDLDLERGGLVPTRQWKLQRFGEPWQRGETLSLGIGQSFLLMTPLQVAGFMAAVFNGGFNHTPQVTQWVGKPEGERIYAFAPRVRGQLGVKPDNLALLRSALTDAVNAPHGTGSRARLDQVKVAGKTGTAQVVALDRDREEARLRVIPWHLRDHAWFTAVAPAEKPRLAVCIMIEHGGQGGLVAAPIAGELIKSYLGAL